MTGAIEFLRKAKEIYSNCELKCGYGWKCPIKSICDDGKGYNLHDVDEAELVRNVMDYQLKEGAVKDE
jgi:hypothetical protein